MTILSLEIEEEIIKEIESQTSNRSEWVRDAIKEKLGKKEKSLQELYIELDELIKKQEILENEIQNKINLLKKDKEQMKVVEQEEIERKLQKAREFMQKWSVIEQFDFIKSFEYKDGWNDTLNLLPIVEKIRESNPEINIGIIQLREYLAKRPKQSD